MKTLVLVLVSFSPAFSQNERCLYIDPKHLSWVFYNGQPRNIIDRGEQINAAAFTVSRINIELSEGKVGYTIASVSAWFCQNLSFVRNEVFRMNQMQMQQLFQHELYHYKITILYAKKMRKHFLTNPQLLFGTIAQTKPAVQKTFVLYNNEMHEFDYQYEMETARGALWDKQKIWKDKIDHELRGMSNVRLDGEL